MKNIKVKILWLKDFLSAGFYLFKTPENTGALLKLGDVIAETTWFSKAVERFEQQDPYGLMEKRFAPAFPALSELKKYPVDSLGYKFFHFISSNKLDTYEGKAENLSKTVWLRERSRRLHDFLHVILNRGTSIKDEICLNAYIVYSIGAPISCLIMWGGLIRLFFTDLKSFKEAVTEIREIKNWSSVNTCLFSLPIEEMLMDYLPLKMLPSTGLK